VGGIREKLLAADRAGVDTVLLPRRNEKDLEDVPERIRRALRLVFVDHTDEALNEALPLPVPRTVAGGTAVQSRDASDKPGRPPERGGR
jgi:ATP-dependent Lon protease